MCAAVSVLVAGFEGCIKSSLTLCANKGLSGHLCAFNGLNTDSLIENR